jgi:hypothetical protein
MGTPHYRGDNFSPRMPCQWYVRGGGEGKRRILIGQSVPPTPFGMAVGRLKLSPLYTFQGVGKNQLAIIMDVVYYRSGISIYSYLPAHGDILRLQRH